MQSISKNILFYKKDSQECQYVIKQILQRKLRNMFIFIDYDMYRYRIPSYITDVPFVLDSNKNHIPLIKLSIFLRSLENPQKPNSINVHTSGINEPPSQINQINQRDLETTNNNDIVTNKGISIEDIEGSINEILAPMKTPQTSSPLNPFESSYEPPVSKPRLQPQATIDDITSVESISNSANNTPFPFTQKIERNSKLSESDIKSYIEKRNQDIEKINQTLKRPEWI